tara:strand:- start:1 stop:753 length:753 start_codon:yes stop_codon:yes gene_type:complete
MSEKPPVPLLKSLLPLDIQPGLVLRAILFALVLPGTLNAAFGVNRQVFLESLALVSTILDSYVRSIFSIFQVIWIEFSDYETALGQFYLFVVFPVFLTLFPENLEKKAFWGRLQGLVAVPLMGLFSTLLLILFLRFAIEAVGFAFSVACWVAENAPLIYFGLFGLLILGLLSVIWYSLMHGGFSLMLLILHFFLSRAYQNYVIVVLASLAFFLTMEFMRLGTGFNQWICQIALMLSPERKSIIDACAAFL